MLRNLKEWACDRWPGLMFWGLVLAVFVVLTYLDTRPWIENLRQVTWSVLGLGAVVVLAGGNYAAQAVLVVFREELEEDGQQRARVVGVLERVVLATAVAASVATAVVGSAAMVWIGAKMAVNWDPRVREAQASEREEETGEDGGASPGGDEEDSVEKVRTKAMSALVASLVSLGLAVAGGLLIRASLPC